MFGLGGQEILLILFICLILSMCAIPAKIIATKKGFTKRGILYSQIISVIFAPWGLALLMILPSKKKNDGHELNNIDNTKKQRNILFCSKCGNKIADNASYCTSCGTPV